jgi:hypothetical protein
MLAAQSGAFGTIGVFYWQIADCWAANAPILSFDKPKLRSRGHHELPSGGAHYSSKESVRCYDTRSFSPCLWPLHLCRPMVAGAAPAATTTIRPSPIANVVIALRMSIAPLAPAAVRAVVAQVVDVRVAVAAVAHQPPATILTERHRKANKRSSHHRPRGKRARRATRARGAIAMVEGSLTLFASCLIGRLSWRLHRLRLRAIAAIEDLGIEWIAWFPRF